jgi:two-component sensor histidine kinase
LIWSFSFSQQYTNISTKDGLPSNHVYTIVQDAKGFMWFLTDKGMVRYNGKELKTFTTKQGLSNNDVWDAYTTPDGRIWYMSKSTHLGYIENDSIFSFPNENEEEIINPLYSVQIGDTVYLSGPKNNHELKDNIWKSFKKSKTSANKIKNYTRVFNHKVAYQNIDYDLNILNLFDENFNVLAQYSSKGVAYQNSSRGQLSDSLLYLISDKIYSFINLNTLELKNFTYKEEVGLESLKHARLNLVGDEIQISGEGFVAKLDKNLHVSEPVFFPSELNAHFGFIDKQNTVWLSTFTNGVYKLPFVKQDIAYKFTNEKVQNLNIVNNKLVASVYNKGFFTYNELDQTFNPYLDSKDYISGAFSIDSLNTNYYLSETSLMVEKGGKRDVHKFDALKFNVSYVNSFIKKLTLFNSNLYGIYSFGIYKLDNETLKIKKDIILRGCNDLLVFNSRLILATNNGLKELKKDSIKTIKFKNENFNKSILSVVPISDSQILINTDGFGSYISDLKTISPLVNSEFLIVQNAYVKGKSIWLGTNSGVLHYLKKENNYQLVRTYDVNDGLPSNNINSVFVTTKDLIVGTNNGLAIVPIGQGRKDLLIDVLINSATFNNKEITKEQSTYNYKSNNVVKFKFESIDFSFANLKNTDYQYKLEPLQTNWVRTAVNTVNYNNLQPGDYVFSIRNKSVSKNISFKIKALWWQTFWFKTLIVLVGVFLVALISVFFVKQSQFKKNQKIFEDKRLSELQLKALRSQMNPHFVFNSLAAIQYYINENDFEASEMYLVKFSKLVRQFFELSKENEISIRVETTLLKNYLEIEKLRFKEKLNFEINIDDSLDIQNTTIPTMILQPIIENAINHGIFNKEDDGEVIVNFIKGNNDTLIVEIIDDGVGFVNTKKRQNENVKSSHVLKDRLHFLNNSRKWNISYSEEEVYPDRNEKGNKSIFIIKKL